jgi:hypothetical protein
MRLCHDGGQGYRDARHARLRIFNSLANQQRRFDRTLVLVLCRETLYVLVSSSLHTALKLDQLPCAHALKRAKPVYAQVMSLTVAILALTLYYSYRVYLRGTERVSRDLLRLGD